uniref:DNA 3'-5' helicase n=1 Tax=Amphimedon queenslandica TaxID=400682 RepID=A0A1X7SVC4_AMPQE
MDSCLTEAAELLGYRNLKDEQISCLTEFLSGRDVFVILPTGFGKTVCFTLLPFAFDKYQKRDSGNKAIIIVVSPLTALIINQVEALLSRNVSAGYINSESTSDVKKNVTLGKYCI